MNTTLRLAALAFSVAVLGGIPPARAATPPRPFGDALAVWHLADDTDATGKYRLRARGAVTFGVRLDDNDARQSRERGGDAVAARFEGGYLEVADGDGVVNLPGQTMTILLRLRDPQGTWNYPLLGSYGGTEQVSYFLHAVDGTTLPMTDLHGVDKEVPTVARWLFGTPGGPKAIHGSTSFLEFLWGAEQPDLARLKKLEKAGSQDFPLYQDVSHAVMRIGCPVQHMGPRDWHDIVVRFTGPKLQLFVDGVIVDEEFPVGQTRQNRVPCLIGAALGKDGQRAAGFHGLMDHVALWNRALSDEEVVELSGGAQHVAQRDAELLGPLPGNMQYFRPRGYNAKAGDCIPFWHDGTFHLFYLFERRNRHSKWDWGHGALEIDHASTRDLVAWKHQPVAVPITEQWEAWNGTGALAYYDGQFQLFHPCPSYNSQWPFTGIQLVTSRDGQQFEKQTPHPFMPGGDCEIYREEATGLFHMLKGAEAPPGRKKLVRLVSSDLRDWQEVAEPFMEVDEQYGVRTCPHLFGWNGRWYFMGGNTIWTSPAQFGPWTLHRPKRLEQLSVPKTAPFAGHRRLMAGFLIDGDWGGNVVVRELVQNADGLLGSKFVPEMTPESGAPIRFTLSGGGASVTIRDRTAILTAGQGPATARIEHVPQNVRISLDVEPATTETVFGLGLRSHAAAADGGCRIEFDPARQLVRFKTMTDSANRRLPGPRAEDVELPCRPLHLELICRHDMVDLEIDHRRTLANRYWDPAGDCLELTVETGRATFKDVEIRPLVDQP